MFMLAVSTYAKTLFKAKIMSLLLSSERLNAPRSIAFSDFMLARLSSSRHAVGLLR